MSIEDFALTLTNPLLTIVLYFTLLDEWPAV